MKKDSEKKHARLSGSRISRALLCPGSVQMELTMPDEYGAAAARGTAIHGLAEALFAGQQPDTTGMPDDMLEEATGYVNAINSYTEGWAKRRLVEYGLDEGLKSIHPELGGTADYVAIGGGRLLVADLKTGRIDVDPTYNSQLLTYAVGVIIQLKAPTNINVTLAIYQGGKLKTWHCSHADLIQWIETLRELSDRVWSTNPVRTPGEACKYCKAKATCPELLATARATAVQSARADFTDVPPWQDLPTEPPNHGQVTAEMLALADTLEAWIESIRAKAKDQLTEYADSITGWSLKPGRKMVQLADPTAAAEALRTVPDAWALKTPAALKKLGVLPADSFAEVRSAPSLVRGGAL